MSNRNEASSLVALRELRGMEKRRLDEAEASRLRGERERREQTEAHRRSEEERQARAAEQQAALASLSVEIARLHGELDLMRAQNVQLRDELERTRLGGLAPSGTSRPTGAQWFGWLGLSAGASMLVGALALSAALRSPLAVPPSAPPSANRPVIACAPAEPATPAARVAVAPAPVTPPAAKPVRPKPPRPPKQPPAVVCDGRDPLCGLPLGTLDEAGGKRGRGGGRL